MQRFIDQVCDYTAPNVFNPYRDTCPLFDTPTSFRMRRETLTALVDRASSNGIEAIWLGRDLGHRGGRRTGLALTDDIHYQDHLARWELEFPRPTSGKPVRERTATVIWNMLININASIFLWNVFPFHPHKAEASLTNRMHNARERDAGLEILDTLIGILQPKKLVAIGNDAAAAASHFDDKCTIHGVRHPSYGGQMQFERQISDIYRISERNHDIDGQLSLAMSRV